MSPNGRWLLVRLTPLEINRFGLSIFCSHYNYVNYYNLFNKDIMPQFKSSTCFMHLTNGVDLIIQPKKCILIKTKKKEI